MPDRSQRTEKATPKRRRDSRRQGQIARSADLGAWLVVLAMSIAIPPVLSAAAARLVGLEQQSSLVIGHPTTQGALRLLSLGLSDTAAIVAPLCALAVVISLFATAAQVGFVLAWKAAKPSASKLNPIKGLKRIVSGAGMWNLLRSTLQLAIIGLLGYRTISGLVHTLVGTRPVAIGPVLEFGGESILGLIKVTAGIGLAFAVVDYLFQRRRVSRETRMTKQEVKEENRMSEGDPAVKGFIRRRQRRISRLRMMAEVARANAVITNPTHVAVAIRYLKDRHSAPVVVAKGSGQLAARIRAEAAAHGVPVIEDPPLARAIYGACEVEDLIPAELYLAVARLLAFVYSLPRWPRAKAVSFKSGAQLPINTTWA
jgi:flagellar biosynthetic protein FlhB